MTLEQAILQKLQKGAAKYYELDAIRADRFKDLTFRDTDRLLQKLRKDRVIGWHRKAGWSLLARVCMDSGERRLLLEVLDALKAVREGTIPENADSLRCVAGLLSWYADEMEGK